MPNADRVQAITDTVSCYIELVEKGSADELAGLYADDATVEDPVGGEVHIGRRAIHGPTGPRPTSRGFSRAIQL